MIVDSNRNYGYGISAGILQVTTVMLETDIQIS